MSDYVVAIPVDDENTTASGLILKEANAASTLMLGRIVHVGPGRLNDGKITPMRVKVGDVVLYDREKDAQPILLGAQPAAIFREGAIAALVEVGVAA